MSIGLELNALEPAPELQNPAVMRGAQGIPYSRDSRGLASMPVVQRSLPILVNLYFDEFKRSQYYPNKSVIFREGESPTGVFMLTNGAVKLSITSSKGRAAILRVARPGDILGLSSVITGEPYLATAETLEETEVAYVERAQFMEFLRCSPEAALCVASQACANYRIACEQIGLLSLCRSASERMARFLLNWAASRGYRDTSPVRLGLTHEEISQIAGTTRETVTRTLTDFRKHGWVSLAEAKLVIQDRQALEKLVA